MRRIKVLNPNRHLALRRFAAQLEQACLDVVANGMMTKDLAQLVGPRQKWLTTDEFLVHVGQRLRCALGQGPPARRLRESVDSVTPAEPSQRQSWSL